MKKNYKLLLKVCVLTKNEEQDLKTCLIYLTKQFKDIIVLDSGSEDRTIEIAESFGCEVLINIPTEKFIIGKQRQWLLSSQKELCEYILFIDADEIISSNFSEKIEKVINKDRLTIDCYELPLIYKYHNKIIKSLGNPNWHDRLIKTTAQFDVSGVYEYVKTNNRRKVDNTIIFHNWNSKGLNKFINKHLYYAENFSLNSSYFENNYKRKIFKNFLNKFTKNMGFLKPPLRFIYHYIFKFGFIEGREGLIVAVHMFIFEFFIEVHKIEKKRIRENKLL